jgi:hypothetical protein
MIGRQFPPDPIRRRFEPIAPRADADGASGCETHIQDRRRSLAAPIACRRVRAEAAERALHRRNQFRNLINGDI